MFAASILEGKAKKVYLNIRIKPFYRGTFLIDRMGIFF